MKKVYSIEDCPFTIGGEGLVDAVEKYFPQIGTHFNIGSVAGYRLISVKLVYDPWLFCNMWYGGKPMDISDSSVFPSEYLKQKAIDELKGVRLIVKAEGSDALVGFDPNNNPVKTTVIKIHANEEDLPAEYEFEIARNQ